MPRIAPAVTFLLIFLPSFCLGGEDLGFDEICRIYTEAQSTNMTKEQLSNYIFSNIEARISVTDAIQAHQAIFHLAPEERYGIFKQAAEYSLKKDWDCGAMKDLLK